MVACDTLCAVSTLYPIQYDLLCSLLIIVSLLAPTASVGFQKFRPRWGRWILTVRVDPKPIFVEGPIHITYGQH